MRPRRGLVAGTVGDVRVRFPGRRDREPRSDRLGRRSPCVAEVQILNGERIVATGCDPVHLPPVHLPPVRPSSSIANVTKVRCVWSETDLHKTNGLSTARGGGGVHCEVIGPADPGGATGVTGVTGVTTALRRAARGWRRGACRWCDDARARGRSASSLLRLLRHPPCSKRSVYSRV